MTQVFQIPYSYKKKLGENAKNLKQRSIFLKMYSAFNNGTKLLGTSCDFWMILTA